MKKRNLLLYAAGSVMLVLCVAWFVAAAQAPGDEFKFKKDQKTVHLILSVEGADLFHAYCATCHGVTGKGDGPIASVLGTPVSDLTTVAKRNGGVFPFTRMRSIIAGDELIKAHGTREMPIWGPIFHQIERDRDYGNIRLQNVTRYVESIQEK